MHALRDGEVDVGGQARRQLALEPDVEAVDARVPVVAVEDADAGEQRERARPATALGASRFGHTGMSAKAVNAVSRKSLFCWMPLVVTDPTWLSMFCRA